MDKKFEELKEEALSLPLESQRALADLLWVEIERRRDAIQRGEPKMADREEATERPPQAN